MDIQTELDQHDGGALVRLDGDLDFLTAPAFVASCDTVVESGRHSLLVDVTDVTFLDSSGLGALITVHKRTRVLGGSLRVAGATGPVRRVLAIAGVEELLGVSPEA